MLNRMSAFLFRNGIRGATRFHALFCGGRRLPTRTKHGLRMRVAPHEYVDSFVLRCGYYEEEVLRAIVDNLGPGDVFWDVGSNLGLHALTVALTRPDARVHAFEPNPEMVGLIRDAAAMNGLAVELHACALSSTAGTADLILFPGNAGMSSLGDWHHKGDQPRITVPTATGDGIVAGRPGSSPNVLKIDVEGCEVDVLRGMPATLAGAGLHTIVLEDCADPDSPAKRILREAGFSVEPLGRREATQHNLDNFVARRGRAAA